jgi:hypothetical protein
MLVRESATDDSHKLRLLGELKHCLQHRRSLFESTRLRLASLQKRVDNTITLSFNLVTQQDSLIMTQDSGSMKTIALITMIFLPTTGVATVLGSSLFDSDDKTGQWEVKRSPLFLTLWFISIPLTLATIAAAYLFHWRSQHHQRPKRVMVEVLSRAASFGRSGTAGSGSSAELVKGRAPAALG